MFYYIFRDRGEYRCTASRSSTGYSRYSDTVYMVVDFYPPGTGYSRYSDTVYMVVDFYPPGIGLTTKNETVKTTGNSSNKVC